MKCSSCIFCFSFWLCSLLFQEPLAVFSLRGERCWPGAGGGDGYCTQPVFPELG